MCAHTVTNTQVSRLVRLQQVSNTISVISSVGRARFFQDQCHRFDPDITLQITPPPRNMGRGEKVIDNSKNLLLRPWRNVADKGIDLAFMTINHRVDSVTSALIWGFFIVWILGIKKPKLMGWFLFFVWFKFTPPGWIYSMPIIILMTLLTFLP